MWMLDGENQKPVHTLQLYLTVQEANNLRGALDTLLIDPEAREHEHVLGGACDLSISLVTDAKRKDLSRYTEPERRLLTKK